MPKRDLDSAAASYDGEMLMVVGRVPALHDPAGLSKSDRRKLAGTLVAAVRDELTYFLALD